MSDVYEVRSSKDLQKVGSDIAALPFEGGSFETVEVLLSAMLWIKSLQM